MWRLFWAEDSRKTRVILVSLMVHSLSVALLCEFLCTGLKCEFVSALRRGVCAHGVEQHAADGGQRPEQTLREKRADRSPNERAAPS